MPNIYASKSEGIAQFAVGAWSHIRDSPTGVIRTGTSSQRDALAINAYHTPGRGSDVYRVSRAFFLFDTSSITSTVTDTKLNIYGYSQDNADVIAVKSDAYGGGASSIVAADFNNFDTSTPYSSEVTSWSTSGYNGIVLNSTALTDIQNDDYFIVCVMEYDHDFQNSAVSNANLRSGVYHVNYTGTSFDPYLQITLSAAGYGNIVTGVAAANIGKVKGVATASIEKVIGI